MTTTVRHRRDMSAVSGRSGLVVPLALSVAAHVGLMAWLGSRPDHLWAHASGAIEVRIVLGTDARVGSAKSAVEVVESVANASGDDNRPANAPPPRPFSHFHASRMNGAATSQKEVSDAAGAIDENPSGALPVAPQSGTTYYADSEVDVMPVALDPIVPQYPPDSNAVIDGGKVTLRLLVDATGIVKNVTVVQASLPEVFEEAARTALTGIHFKPAEKYGKAVACQMLISIEYASSRMPGLSAEAR